MMSDEIVWAIKNGDMEKLTKFTSGSGFDVNAPLKNRKPIHIAADYGQTEMVEYLISQGANINDEDDYGITPLLAAIYEGHRDCVELLITKGADTSRKAPDGQSYAEVAEDESIRNLLK